TTSSASSLTTRDSPAKRCSCLPTNVATGSTGSTSVELDSGSRQTATLHNARFGLSTEILYPYHPFFGEDYEVFGAAGGKRDLIYIRLADKSSKGVPAWMFDPAICAGVRLADDPVIDCGALWRLADLL